MHTTAHSERRPRKSGFLAALGVAAGILALAPEAALADEAPASGDRRDAAAGGAGAKAEGGKADGGKGGELIEDPLKRYYFLGVRFRDIVVPQFMMEIFAQGGGTGNAWLIGPELSMRKNRTEIDIALAYADYGFG